MKSDAVELILRLQLCVHGAVIIERDVCQVIIRVVKERCLLRMAVHKIEKGPIILLIDIVVT